MTVQYSTTLRNARLDANETTIGTSPKLQLRTGAQPANCAAADSGTLIAEVALPSDWANAAANGAKTGAGLPWAFTAVAAGTLGHYRLKDNGGTNTHEQGSITATGGGGDMTVDNTNVANGQTGNVTTWTKTEGNP